MFQEVEIMQTKEEKYLKVIEGIGELLQKKDNQIKLNEYEIKNLKKKIESIEQHIDFYSKKEVINE
jgi:predicted membrane chloride channel (bestrophin family)